MRRLLLACLVLVAACKEEVAVKPPAVPMTDEALGYFCQMSLREHKGPVAQVHLANHERPLWFSQVRDAIAFARMPEEMAEITAIYVSDMSSPSAWQETGSGRWLDVGEATYVIGGETPGGMGAPEAVPFADAAAAAAYASGNGGRVAKLGEIPDGYVLGPVEIGVGAPGG